MINWIKTKSTIGVWAVSILLSGCDGNGSSSTEVGKNIDVEGAVQKGPFIIGSSVTINNLSNEGENTDATIITSTTDDLGSFSFSTSTAGLVQLSSTGYYRNEITGELSQGTLTLRSIYNVTVDDEQQAYINLLTHITNNRILNIIKNEGGAFDTSVEQAETEFLISFGGVVENSGESDFSALSIFENRTTNSSAYLLAISSILYQYSLQEAINNSTNPDAELSLLINQLESDFADDGSIDNSTLLESLRNVIPQINPTQVTANINSWIDGEVEYVSADINEYLDTDLDGVFNISDLDSDNDGMDDSEDPFPYVPGFIVHDQEVTTNEDMSIEIDISANNPLNTTTYLDITSQPTHGVLSGNFPELTYTPINNYSGADYFNYVLSQETLESEEVTVMLMIHSVNDAPIISGNPLNEIVALNNYSFTPAVINIESDQLAFSIENKPSWANFNESTGELSGTPINESVGMYGNIIIGVSDGDLTEKLNPFSISVLGNPWSEVSVMPSGLTEPAVVAHGSKVFVIGGSFSAKLNVYDTISGLWQEKPSLAIARRGHSAHIINDTLYVVGGERKWKEIDSLVSYNIQDELWAEREPLSIERSFHASCVYDKKIFVFGGFTSNGIEDDGSTHTKKVSSVEVYDPVTNQWAAMSSMSKANWGMSCVTVNDLIYVIGGAENERGYMVYNPSLDSWQGSGTLNIPRRYGFSTSVIEGMIYVMGGYQCTSGCKKLDSVDVLDPVNANWVAKTSIPREPNNLGDIGSVAVNNKVYTFGDTESILIYDPSIDTK